MSRHIARAHALAVRVLHQRDDADDLVQDAFLAALEHLEAFDVSRPFWPWLARIIANRGLDIASSRAVRYTESLPDDLIDSRSGTPLDGAVRREIIERFRRELALLPPRQQLIIQLVELDGYDVAEIAGMLSLSPSTVRWHVHAARQRLRDALSPLRDGGP